MKYDINFDLESYKSGADNEFVNTSASLDGSSFKCLSLVGRTFKRDIRASRAFEGKDDIGRLSFAYDV